MIIETELIKEYQKFIKSTSVFGDSLKVLPSTPQSFSSFPTIIIREANNTDYRGMETLDRSEYGDYITYQVDIYTKDVVIGNTKYIARTIINEIRELNHKFFRKCGFQRTYDANGEYIDINVKRRTQTFHSGVQSWNKSII